MFLNSLMRNATYIQQNPDSNLALICECADFPLFKFFNLFGSNCLEGTPKFIETLYPASTLQRLHVVKDMVLQLELNPSFFFRSSLRHSVFAIGTSIIDRFVDLRLTAEECSVMAQAGFYSVGDLLQRTTYKDKFIFNLNLTEKVRDPELGLTETQIRKLDWLVGNVRKHILPGKLRLLPSKKFKSHIPINTFFYHSVYKDKHFVSKALKLLMVEQNQAPPPGLLTRVRDGVGTYEIEDVMRSFKRILNEKIPMRLKSLHIEFVNRTLWSRNKLFKFGLVENPNCGRCQVVATTEHCIFECSFPSFCATKIATYLDNRIHGGVPHINLAREKLFLYNMYIEELQPRLSSQVMNLILTIKKSCLDFASDDRWLHWNRVVFYAQLFAHTRKVITQRLFMALDVEMLNDFLAQITEEFSNEQ